MTGHTRGAGRTEDDGMKWSSQQPSPQERPRRAGATPETEQAVGKGPVAEQRAEAAGEQVRAHRTMNVKGHRSSI